jgi:maleate cis-trans isomerase
MELAGCDALVLLATDLPTFASIEPLERALGIPVVSSNQAILWAALRGLGAPPPARALGRLFRQ